MKTLVVAEKPSVARDIARVLGVSGRQEGYLENDSYVVTWALGHLVTLMEPDEINPEYKKWRMDVLPILPENIPTKVISRTKSQYMVIKKLMKSKEIEDIVCATDSGREGELIFRLIYDMAGCKKPVKRLWISSMTDQAIRQGFDNMLPASAYDALYVSAKCRSEADWMVGMNASRAFTLKYNALLPIGRVQTPTLALIVERDREIAEFVPKDYYEVRANFGDYEGLYYDPESKETRVYSREKADEIRGQVSGKEATVSENVSEKKRVPPPNLFDLTLLQREANKMYGFSADKTLKIAQSLYETRKLITYPRTDSRFLPHDMVPKVEKVMRGFKGEYGEFAGRVLTEPLKTGSRIYDDAKISDHHAIVPTGQYVPSSISPDESKVYDMVVRRLIAVHYPDYEYESRRVMTKCEGHLFRSTGTTPLVMGWKELYPFGKNAQKEKEQVIPPVAVGDVRKVKKATVKAQKTKPPVPHNDASILQLMENAGQKIEDEKLRESMRGSGLGTPATRAAIIERLIHVGYVKRQSKTLISTDKGRQLVSVVPTQISSAVTTGKWEKALSDMASLKDPAALEVKSARFMQGIARFSHFLVDAAKAANTKVHFEREPAKKK